MAKIVIMEIQVNLVLSPSETNPPELSLLKNFATELLSQLFLGPNLDSHLLAFWGRIHIVHHNYDLDVNVFFTNL